MPDHDSSYENQLNAIRKSFEKEWDPNQRPDFIQLLLKVDEQHRESLLLMLVEADIRLLRNAKLDVSPDMYHALGSAAFEHARHLIELNPDTDDRPQDSESIEPATASIKHEEYQQRKRIGPYKLLQQIGEGGMGTVWMAEQVEPVKRRVALKLIRDGVGSRETIARFEAERQALAMMDHQNIARVLDAGTTENGQPYFVMELVEGIPITEFCDQQQLSINERLKLFIPVCKAVQHAHQKGIIHRDLKPSNVLVTLYDGRPVPKVIDFGLAKALQHTHKLTDKTLFTEFGKVVGTLQYMSPEQAEMNALDIDTRSDIYSLGVMLYELLTGSTPLDKETVGKNALLQVLAIIRETEPPRPSHRLSSSSDTLTTVSAQRKISPTKLQQLLRGELDWVVMKALDKDRKRRYETPNDLAEDIDCYLEGDAIQARPPSTAYRASKFLKKHRTFVTTATTIFVLLIAGIIGTTYGLFAAKSQAEIANEEKDRADGEAKTAKINEDRAIDAEKLAENEAQRARDSEAAAKFQLAVARWDSNRAAEARDLLYQIPLEYRDNFEWNFCHRHFLGSDFTCYGHTSDLYSVAYSPDGNRLASGSRDKTIRLWDAKNGSQITTLTGHSGSVTSVEFSPDGTQIVSASTDKTIKLWDVKSGSQITTLTGHSGSVTSVEFSPDGTQIVSASTDKSIRLWDAETGSELINFKKHTSRVTSVAFSPTGTQIASGSWDKTIRLWDAKTGSEIAKLGSEIPTLQGHRGTVACVAFSPDGTRIVSGSGDNTIKLWDVKSASEVATLKGLKSTVRCVAFSPDGTRIVSGSDDNTIKLWDVKSASEIATLKGHRNSVECTAFSPCGTRIVSGSGDTTIKIWDARNGNEILALLAHSAPVNSVAFSPDGTRIVSGSYKAVKVWDAKNECVVSKQSLGPTTLTNSNVVFSPDGQRVASTSQYTKRIFLWPNILIISNENSISIWDTKNENSLITLKGHKSRVRCFAFSPDGTRIVSGSGDNTIKLWDVKSASEIATLKGHRNSVECVAFSPDGTRIVSGNSDTTIKIWDARNGNEILTLLAHSAPVNSAAFSPDGTRIVSGSDDHTIKIWDARNGNEILTLLAHSAPVNSVAFSPDGTRIVSGSDDHTIKIWDARNGNEILTLLAHSAPVNSVAFSPDGTRIVSGSDDHTIKIWDAEPSHEVFFLAGHTSDVESVAFGPLGKKVYSRSNNEKLVWDIQTRQVIEEAGWPEVIEKRQNSPDGRWFVTNEGKHVVLIDREFKNTPDEKAYREFKARLDPYWHSEQAEKAQVENNFYAATFHYAWVMKAQPDDPKNYDNLHNAFEKLAEQYKADNKPLDPYLAPIVKQMLKLPRGCVEAN